MHQVIEVNRIDELEHYYLTWQTLLAKTKRASFFQSLDWLQAYWRHFGAGQKLRVLIVYRQGEPIGILPLVVRREQTRVGIVRTLTYPLHDWASFYGPISAEPGSTLHAAMEHLRQSRRDWDLIDLRWINGEIDLKHTPRAMQASGFDARPGIWQQTSVIDMTTTWDEYLASKTTKFRNDLRRRERRIDELGGFTFERYRPLGASQNDGDPRLDLYDECIAVAESSWQGSSENGTTLSHDSVADFLRESHTMAARAGALDLSIARHNDRAVAFCYNLQRDGYVFGLRIGYHPDYHKAGVGSYLYAKTFQDSFERGDQEFDMGPGSLEYKKTWRTSLVPILRYTHYASVSPRGQLLRWKHYLVGAACEQTLQETNAD